VKVDRSIAEGRPAAGTRDLVAIRGLAPVVGLAVACLAIALYLMYNPERHNLYNHFVWQADAFLRGEVSIPFPVQGDPTRPDNAYLQDVYPILDGNGEPTGRVLIPFPPLPAIVLLPFVALFGLRVDQELIAALLGGINVGVAWWMLGRLPVGLGVRVLISLFFAAGTALWWTSSVGSTWYFAHSVAMVPMLLAIGIALGADPAAAVRDARPSDARLEGRNPWERWVWFRDEALPIDGRQFLAGLLLGVAATARLPVVLGAPFLMLVGGGGGWPRRAFSAGVGALIPVTALLLYTYATTGAFIHPGYDYQYQLEAWGYGSLGYNPEWAVEDLRYIPQNLLIMFGAMPALLPDVLPNTLGYRPDVPVCTEPGAVRELFSRSCPIAVPRDIGTSVLLVSPALLLMLLPLRRVLSNRLAAGAGAAILLIALFNLAHFSQGWVQWGYRFSNDWLPFALPLVALGAAAPGGRARLVAIPLVLAALVVNHWGVTWGQLLGW
jgi:hypothetical protein